MKGRLTALLALGCAAPLAGQASPVVTADDPRLPLFEHLVIRGDVADPSPMWRPIRRRQVFEALNQATGGQLAAKLIEEFQDQPLGRLFGENCPCSKLPLVSRLAGSVSADA